MNNLINFLQTENGVTLMFVGVCISIVLSLLNIMLTYKQNNKIMKYMKKLGNGNNLFEMLSKYLDDVKEIKRDNSEIKAYYTKLDSDIASCISHVGVVRYNAFRDVGSDLSFAVALLDMNNDGVVFNGLYGSESSNIYAKPIRSGKSKYKLSEEEEEAIEIAKQGKNFISKMR